MSLATELTSSTALTPPPSSGYSASRAPVSAPHQQGQEPDPAATGDDRNDNSIDAIALRQALADAEAEEQAQAAGQQPQPAATPAPPGQQPAAAPAAGQPNAAIARLRSENRAFRERIAYLEGLVQGAQPGTAQPQQPTEPAPTPAAPSLEQAFAQTRARIQGELQTLEQRMLALADRLDNGELTNRQHAEQMIELRRAEQTLYLEDFAAWVNKMIAQAAPPPSVSLADEILLENQIKTLETNFPWSTVLTDAELHRLARMVEADYAGRGQPLVPGARKTFLVRQGVAQLAQAFGPLWHPEIELPQQPQAQPQTATPSVASTTQPPRTPTGPIPQPTRSAQVTGKMALAAGHPPATAGAPASGMVGVTEADVDNMTFEEINALPPQVKERLLNGR